MLLGAQLLHEVVEKLLATRLLQVIQLILQVKHLVKVVQGRVVHVVVAVFVVLIVVVVLVLLVRVDVDVGVLLVLADDRLAVVLHVRLLSLLLTLELLLADLDAAARQEGQCLDDVLVLVLDAVRHLATVDEQSGEAENESLDLEVVLHVLDLLEHELEEGVHGALLVEHAHGLAHVVPEAHRDTLQKHDLVVGRLCVVQLRQLELQNALDNV